MRVSQFADAKNQFIIKGDKFRMFQSYKSAIAKVDYVEKTVHLSEHWDYSRTTAKYRNKFLNETTKETEAKIKSGEYKMDLGINGKLI